MPLLQKLHGRLFQYFATFTGVLTLIPIGANTSWTSPYLPFLLSNESTIPTTKWEGSVAVSGQLAGCIVGAVLASYIADKIGRRNSMMYLSPVLCLGFVGIAFAKHIWFIIALRIILGIADGAICTILPMYIGEIADPEIRGFLTSSIQIFFITGMLLINALGPYTTMFTSALIVAGITAIQILMMIAIPESPYHLVKVEEYEKAKYSLKVFRKQEKVNAELDSLKSFIAKDALETKAKFSDLFTSPSNRKACSIFFILLIANRLSGKAVMMYFTQTIFIESGSTIDPALSAIVYNVVELASIFPVTFFLIDRFGRRFLMIISSSGCTLTILVLAIFFYLKSINSSVVNSLNWLPIVTLIVYNILHSIGLAFGFITYLSECFSMNVKANASCLAEILLVGLGIVSLQFFERTSEILGFHFPFFCYAIITSISTVLIYKMVPETKGKTLMEVQELLIGNSMEKNLEKC